MDFFGIDENQFNLYIDLEIAEVGKKRWAHSQKEWPVCILNSMKDMEAGKNNHLCKCKTAN